MQSLYRSSLKTISRERYHLLLLLTVIGVGIFLRLYNLGAKSFWQDEAWNWQVSSLEYLLSTLTSGERSYMLYRWLTAIINPWAEAESTLRLLSAIPGILAMLVIYMLVRVITDKQSAFFAVLLLAFAESQVFYSQQLREFSWMVMLSALILLCFYLYITRLETKFLAGFILFSLLGVLTYIGMAFLIAGLGLTTLFAMLKDSNLRQGKVIIGFVVYAILVVAAASIVWRLVLRPYVGQVGTLAISGEEAGYWSGSLTSFYEITWRNSWKLLDFSLTPILSSLFLFFFVWGAFTIQKKTQGYIVLGMVSFPILVSWLAALLRLYPYSGWRQNIYLTVGLYVLMGVGLYSAYKFNKALTLPFVFLATIILVQEAWIQVNAPGSEEMRPVAANLCEHVGDTDKIFVQSEATFAFDYYWQQCSLWEVGTEWRVDNPYTSENESDENSRVVFGGPIEGFDLEDADQGWLMLAHLNEGERNRVVREMRQTWGYHISEFDQVSGVWLYFIELSQE